MHTPNRQSDNINNRLPLSAVVLLGVCLMLAVLNAHAQVVNFDVPGGESGGVNYSGPGAYADPGHNYWNPIAPGGTTAASLNSDGTTASTVTLAENQSSSYNDGGPGTQGAPSGLQSYFAYANGSAIKTNSLNHVAAGTYTLYLYGINGGASDCTRGTIFTVFSDLTAVMTNGTINTKSAYNAFIQGNDYVVFTNIVVGAGGTITFTYTRNPAATGVANNTEGDFNGLQLFKANTAPSINSQPTSASPGLGISAQLVAMVSGALPLSYQWQKGTNGVYIRSTDVGDVTGSLTNILNFSAVTMLDAADYRLIVTNLYGAATSQVATVTVTLSPQIQVQPASMTLVASNEAQLTAVVSGVSPLVYQWQKGTNGIFVNSTDAGDVSGSLTNALNFSAITALDAADYQLIVTNAFGSTTSQVATVSVLIPSDDSSQRSGFSSSYPTNYSDWANGYFAGDGKLGIIVFCNPLNEQVVYNDRGFNMAKTSDRSFAQVSTTDLATIKSNCAAGNFLAANTLAVSSAQYQDGGEGNRHPGYEMLISIPPAGSVNNYSRVCNFRTGEISVNWTDNRGSWTRRSFVSRQDDVIVQYLTAPIGGTVTCSLQLATDPGMNFPSGMTFTNLVNADFLNMRVQYAGNTGGAGYEGVCRVVAVGGAKTVNGTVLAISNATSVILLTRTQKYYSNSVSQWNQQLLQSQLAALPTDYASLLNGQLATHEAIYDRVKLDLNASASDRAKSNDDLLTEQKSSATPVNALWERIFDAGRYYYLSSSSSNTPPDLLGMWTGDCNVGWGGFYHLDANLNLQIDQGNIGDMPEAMAGYFKLNEVWQGDFEINASKLLGCRGMVAAGNSPGTISGLMAAINTYYPYQYATGEEGWLLYPFWEHYLITGDTNFLANNLYPLLRDMGYFYEDFLKLTDTNGNYILAGSVSPENQPSNLAVSLLNDSTFDISGAKFCLTTLIQTCNILGLEQGAGQEVARWTAILNKLPPYLINSDGALAEWSWPGLADNYNHRHSSGLLPVWPFREITPENNPVLFNAATVTLAKKDQYNYENAGHGLLHAALIGANLKNPTSATAKLMRLTKEDFYFNSLASSHYNNHGVFCTDTCNAVPGILIEMLVCSSPGTLELLPALSPTLTQGAISGVKGRNRMTVQNLSWNLGNSSVTCVLKSDIDQTITLIERDGVESISTSAKVSASPLGEIARTVLLQAGVSTSITLGLGQLRQAPVNLAVGQPVYASSTNDGTVAASAVDGDLSTRWGSAYSDPQWIYVDLGTNYNITSVQLVWETAYGKAYQIQVATNVGNWVTIYSTTNGNGGTEILTNLTGIGRYVRMYGTQRATSYGYSLYEFEVFGSLAAPPAAPATLTDTVSSNQVSLAWAASSGATGYNLKWSNVSGGTYAVLATNMSGLTFTDTGLNIGTTYYYVVSATNSFGESPNSIEVAARTVSTVVPQISLAFGNGSMQFNWPGDHIGWRLEAQTNVLGSGLGTNWITIFNSNVTNQISLPVDAGNGSVFFRLVYP